MRTMTSLVLTLTLVSRAWAWPALPSRWKMPPGGRIVANT